MAKIVSISLFKPSQEYAGHRLYARHLAAIGEKNEVTVVAVDGEPNRIDLPRINVLEVAPTGKILRTFPPKATYLVLTAVKLMSGLSMGIGVGRRLRSGPLAGVFREADVVELQWSPALALARDVRSMCPGARIVAYFHEVLSDPLNTPEYRGSKFLATLAALLLEQEKRTEVGALRYLDAVVVLSRKDADLLSRLGFNRLIYVVDPPIEVSGVVPPVHQGRTVLFSGHFTRPQNSGGAKWLIEQVWPLVFQKEPQARLVIAGSSPPSWLQDLRSGSITITGFVPDLNEYYAGARVFAAPLLSGAGVKFKVLEAMAHNVPVVATPVAADGIVDVIGEECFVGISDDPEVFAECVLAALKDDDMCHRLVSRAVQEVESHYSFELSTGRLATYYGESAGRGSGGSRNASAFSRFR